MVVLEHNSLICMLVSAMMVASWCGVPTRRSLDVDDDKCLKVRRLSAVFPDTFTAKGDADGR